MATIDTTLVTAAQKHQYEEQGYFITDVLLGEDVLAPVRAEFERFWNDGIAAARSIDEATLEQATYRPFLAHLHESSPICRDFCRHPVFAQLGREMLGPDVDLTWNQAIIKPPAPIDNTFSWHQDMWYATHGPYKDDCDLEILNSPDSAITTWVAITRTIVDNGTLWVLPGMHHEGLLPHVRHDTLSDWVGQFDTSYKIPVVMRAGQILVFNKYLPHGSGANTAQETRMAYQMGYSIKGLKPDNARDMLPLLRGGEAAA